LLGTPSTSDNCTVSGITNDAPAVFPSGTTTVTWTVTDNSGNTATCVQTITVSDTEDPEITCPSDITIMVPPCTPFYYVQVTLPVVTDNCGISTVVNSFNGTSDASGMYPIGVTVVYWTVTDIHGNTNVCSMTVIVTGMELSFNTTDLYCYNGYMGSAEVEVINGMQPYSYNWSNGETAQMIDSVAAGTYTITVTDNCGMSAIGSVTVNQPYESLQVDSITGQHITCYGMNDGYFMFAASGGVPPYAYSIDNIAFFYVDTFELWNLPPATYWVTVLDANNCVIIQGVEIHQPDSLNLTTVVTDVTCYSGNNGSVDLSVTGGTTYCQNPVYTYIWSNGETTQDISGLASGTYLVTVIDLNGCTATSTVTVNQPSAPLSLIINSTNITCYGVNIGSVDMFVSGGTAPYTNVWSNGATTEDLNGLPAGEYSVTVTDANGCITTAVTFISQANPVTVDLVATGSLCYGETNGTVSVFDLNGLTPPVSYLWSNGSTESSLNDLGAGHYCVVLTDSFGCLGNGCENVTAPASPVSINAQVGDVLCHGGNDGAIIINLLGGTLPYYGISWSGEVINECDTIELPVTSDVWACCGSSPSTFILNNLQAGTYYVTATDANNCIATDTIVVEQPSGPLTIENYQVENVDVINDSPGSVNIFVCCGTFPYIYWWENEDGIWMSDTEDLNDVPAGNYSVTVTDANGCTVTGSFIVGTNAVPEWNFYNTGYNHTIYVPFDAVPFLEYGDYIGVFYDSLGTLACGGYTKYEDVSTTIAAWGEDGITPNTGFDDGEVFTFRFWKLNTGTEYWAHPVYNLSFPQDSLFIADGLSGLLSLTPYSVLDSQLIVLHAGWNIMSTYMIPVHPDVQVVFSNIEPWMVIVKDGYGNVYWPVWSVNTIGDMVLGTGYKVKMSSTKTLSVYGYSVIPEFTPVVIPQNWSILGYLRNSPASVVIVMSTVVSEIEIMKDENGYVYWPALQINTIINMYPGEGYQIKMNSAQILLYPENGQLSQTDKYLFDYCPKHYPVYNSTGKNMTVGIPVDSWDIIPEPGDEIAAFDAEGNIAGSTVFDGKSVSLTIWGDDDISGNIEGIRNNCRFSMRLWHSAAGKEEIIEVKSWLSGDDKFSEDGISIVDKLETIVPDNSGMVLYQNMPNPFDESTFIRFDLPVGSYAELKIFDVLGNLVSIPVSEYFTAGEHIIKLDMTRYAPGVYSYRLDCEKVMSVRSMIKY
jgi:hypothetical protein